MAAFKNKDNGTWYVQFRYTDWRGERQQKLKRGFPTKKAALAWEREFLMKKQADLNMTLESFVELYTQRIKGEDVITCPKTKKSNRVIQMPQFLSDEIQDYIKQQKLTTARKDARIWKERYEKLLEQTKDFLAAVKRAPEKVRAFLDRILHSEREVAVHRNQHETTLTK